MTCLTSLKITSAALARAKELLHLAPEGIQGLRLSVSRKGCSGFAYCLDYATSADEEDVLLDRQGIRFFIDPEAFDYLEDTEIDYVEGLLSSEFVFRNPYEKGRCGCGKSFYY